MYIFHYLLLFIIIIVLIVIVIVIINKLSKIQGHTNYHCPYFLLGS
jgi:hypothetical protein